MVRPLRSSPAFLAGLLAVAAARLLSRPWSPWEGDETLFIKGVRFFDPVHHQPHPPGYPLLIGLGKMLNAVLHDPFASLVALSIISSLVAYGALVDAFERMAGGEPAAARRVGVAGAVLFSLSPAMLVYGPLALSDPPALMSLALALAAAARLAAGGSAKAALALGVFASAAVGCRPQLALAVLPMLAAALLQAPGGRRKASLGLVLAAFTAMSLLWFVPLVLAVGGLDSLVPFLTKQAGLVAKYDTEAPRSGGWSWVAVRFLAHPWGTRWTSLPVLGLAAAGIAALVWGRRSRALPLLVLCGIDLAFALLVMNPFDAVRYALPSLLLVAFLAALGLETLLGRAGLGAAALPAAGLLAAGFVAYTQPLLAARSSSMSPPIQAIQWVKREVPLNAVIVVDTDLAPHTSCLLRKHVVVAADPSLQRVEGRGPTTPVYLLANGESTWPGAVTFRWPDSDAYGKLTRGRFRVVSVSPIPPEKRYKALRGVSIYEPSFVEPAWRWLGPDAAIRLDLRGAPAHAVAVTLGLPPHAPAGSVAVVLAMNGGPAQTVEVPRGGSRRVELPVPDGAAAAEVTFRSAASFVPAEVGLGTDRRRLSVQLLQVEREAPGGL